MKEIETFIYPLLQKEKGYGKNISKSLYNENAEEGGRDKFEMTKARFYIMDKPLQGLRVSPSWACGVVGQSPTMEKILNSGLNGTAINAGLNVPDSDSMRSSQALMLEQLSKGIETGIKMKNRIVYIVGRIRSKLHSSLSLESEGGDEGIKYKK